MMLAPLTRARAAALALLFVPCLALAQSQRLWSAHQDVGSATLDRVSASATDGAGNTYLLGTSGPEGSAQVVLSRFSQAGAVHWTRTLTPSGSNGAIALQRAPSGGVVAAYRAPGLQLARYDAAGSLMWVATSFPEGLEFSDLAIDAGGGLRVAGTRAGRIWLGALSSAGEPLWSQERTPVEGGQDRAGGIALDAESSAYVSGSVWSGTSLDAAVLKYDSTGALQWTRTYNGPDGGADEAVDVAVDPLVAAVYVAGTSSSGGLPRALFMRIESVGTFQWARLLTQESSFRTLVVDPFGKAVGVGTARGASSLDVFAARISASSNLVWSRLYDGPAGGDDEGRALAIDKFGTIYVAGDTLGTGGSLDYALLKLAPTGALLWPTSGEGYHSGAAIFDSFGQDDAVRGLGLDDLARAYVAGRSVGPSGTPDLHVAKYGPVDDARFVTQSVPKSMVAGQTYDVSITLENIGASTWTHGAGYRLMSRNPADNTIWGFSRVYLSSSDSIATGQTKKFQFRVIAPSADGTYNFQWRMLRDGVGSFGESTPNLPIPVAVRAHAARYMSQKVPSSVKAGSTFTVTVTIRNVGTNTWTQSGGYTLRPEPGYPTWGVPSVPLGAADSIARDMDKVFTFVCTAPGTPGSYTMRWRMHRESSSYTDYFGDRTTTKTITVVP